MSMLVNSNFYQNPKWLWEKNNFEVEGQVTIVCDHWPKIGAVMVRLTKPGATFNLLLTGRPQTGEIMLAIIHNAPKTKSVIMGALILDSKNKLDLRANVLLSEQARGAETQTDLRALGTDSEKITLEPNLEIKSQPEKASHAAAAGAFDQAQLAYLTERGITKARAQNLLAAAFLDHAREKFFTLAAIG